MTMIPSQGPVAVSADSAKDFFVNLVTGVAHGDLLSIAVVGIVALVILRFAAARWVFTLAKQLLIFGGLGFAVWWSGQEVQQRYGDPLGQLVLYGGFAIVGVLLFAMLYMFFLRRTREQAFQETREPGRIDVGPGGHATRVGAGALQHQGLPVHRQKTGATVHASPATAPMTPRPTPAGGAAPVEEHGRVEDLLRKINVLGASKDQNLLTVMVLILVAEFGVFTSRTIAAPDPQVGMVLFAVFAAGAVVFIKTSYKNYLTGIRHFVFATIFAVGLSLVMLVYWQQTYCVGGGECVDPQALTWSVALNPNFYFQSDGLIAAITAVAFSTLLTKGGG